MTKNFKEGEIVRVKQNPVGVLAEKYRNRVGRIKHISSYKTTLYKKINIPNISVVFFMGKKPYYVKRFSIFYRKELTDATEEEKKDFFGKEADWESLFVARSL